MRKKLFSRRQWLRLMGAGALGWCGAGMLPLPRRAALAAEAQEGASPDLEVQLAATMDRMQLLPGAPTHLLRYRGQVIQGDAGALIQDEHSYLGPAFRVEKGQKVRVHLRNELTQPTIVHWHGLKVNDRADGHPRFAFPPGGRFTVDFEVINRAGTYWYHPHPHQMTGPQVYGGLAGFFLVSDAQEEALNLPSGAYDLPLVIQDRRFDAQNQLLYLQTPMDRMSGFFGDRILVNGQVDAGFEVAARAYRLRLLNGSNARIYRLAWEDGQPLVVIGTDGGLLGQAVDRPAVMLGPGERIDLWVDFGARSPGERPALVSLAFEDGAGMMGGMGGGIMGRGMMGGGMRGQATGWPLPPGAPFRICTFAVQGGPGAGAGRPGRLNPPVLPRPAEAVNYGNPKPFYLDMRHMQWTINGRVFEMTATAAEEVVQFGSAEIWDFVNRGGMMGMQMPHPMHLHGVHFRILERIGGPAYEFFDEGWKDTTLVWQGQTVRLLIPFEDHRGLFLYHCHNLEHEDQGMMRNLLIR